MYATLDLFENSKHSGKLIGVHQKLDKAARKLLTRKIKSIDGSFPDIKEILHFEGSRGPDGIKKKSPGVDDPDYFIVPGKDDGVLFEIVMNHQHNLTEALKNKNRERAAFEAAWMAHALTDALTPAHHYPYRQVVDELMTDKDYKKLFGHPIKGIMRGETLLQAARNNWLYWGAGGVMTKHIAYEYGVAYIIAPIRLDRLMPKQLSSEELKNIDLKKEFYAALERIDYLKMYQHFLDSGWTTQLAVETREILIPEIVRLIVIGWASSIELAKGGQNAKKK
ncbi:hypothetical protein IKX12_03660 [Candidatus Saccharibacteria bacterium]|nr:hypothetical protein [Candidatus Saccharibacteria bacterium]